ncbi:MAG: hypothetical protein EHM85_08225 [Desulfobacteraceae bacterium]|nr:MAG: hypothetical protein EHM85_08225 [Desulfobacteraceae bacterium]
MPDAISEKRMLNSDKNHLDGTRLDAYDMEQYDNDTVFYDVFFDIKNKYLYTVGPPFLNLQKILFPINCRINNDKKQYPLQVNEYFNKEIAIGRVSLKNLPLYDENLIEIDFNKRFQWSGRIKLNRFEIKPIILTTIQKDNRIRWINEWVEFYSRNFKIDQTIIYDNNSSNRDDLKAISNEKLLIVSWPFKYGPIRSHDNQFCQRGSLNHCRLKFGSDNMIMNFDIDELLYLEKPELQRYINRYDLILFNAYRVPYVKPVSEDYSYKDFSFRDSEPQVGGRKYVYRPSSVIANDRHNVLLKKHRKSLYKRLKNRYAKLCEVQNKSWVLRCLLRVMSMILKMKIVPINEAYYLHYTGISTNWKSIYWNRKEDTSLTDKHVLFNIFKT